MDSELLFISENWLNLEVIDEFPIINLKLNILNKWLGLNKLTS